MEHEAPYVVETETADETYDDNDIDDVAFLAPRLATYAPVHAEDADALGDAAEADQQVGNGGEVHQDTPNEETDGDEAAAVAADEEDADENATRQSDEEEVEEVPGGDPIVRSSLFDLHETPPSDGDDNERDLASLLAVSRVRELLKFEGSSSIVAKNAAQAASEAVVLILRDLAKTAADQATRKKRKTVHYDDFAAAAKLYDRFAYLADILPPSETTGSRAVQVGGTAATGGFLRQQTTNTHPTATAATGERKKRAARRRASEASGHVEKTGTAMKHPTPGEAGLKQTSLRF